LRHPRGEVLMADRHLLSLKDLDLSAHLAALLSAGVDSFKIEGRLKDENYVKNVTAAYRQALDALLAADSSLRPGSSGRCRFSFIPDTSRTFHRGKTDYFLVNRRNTPGAPDTPKAIGQPLGRVGEVGRDYLTLETAEEVHNGDGLCSIDGQGRLVGIRVNRVTANRIYPRDRPSLPPGTMVYRNLDTAFLAELARSSGCRKLSVRMQLTAVAEGLQLTVCDEDGLVSTATLGTSPQQAKSSADLSEAAARQLRKSGGTPFVVVEVKVELPSGVYYAGRLFNELRRQALENHLERRLEEYRVEEAVIAASDFPWPGTSLGYGDNIANRQALAFYRRHGVSTIAVEGLEAAQAKTCQLMTCKYCLRAQLSLCPRDNGQVAGNAESLLLADDAGEYLLSFLCDRCEMTVRKYGGKGTKGS
jgi:23S rRNA 5-hydroxycytidine C2501 synthase